MMGFFGSSGGKDPAQQAAEQAAWRAEVSSTDTQSGEPHWKPLDDWVATYEPHHPVTQPSAAQSYMAAKAKQFAINKVQTAVTNKMFTMAQETTSKVLSKAEEEVNAVGLQNSTAKNNEAWTALASLLNNLNGIVLTYRFEKDDPTKFRYLRRVASDAVADILQKIFESAEDAGKHIEDLRTNITTAIESQKGTVKTFVETSLDDALQEAAANTAVRTEEKLEELKKQLKAVTEDAVSTLDKVAGVTTPIVDPRLLQQIEELETDIQKQREGIKDESIAMLSDCIKLLVLKKMDTLTVLLVFALDKLFDSVEVLYKTQNEFKLTQQQLRDEVFKVIETTHSDNQRKVSVQVRKAATVLEAIVADSGNDDAS